MSISPASRSKSNKPYSEFCPDHIPATVRYERRAMVFLGSLIGSLLLGACNSGAGVSPTGISTALPSPTVPTLPPAAAATPTSDFVWLEQPFGAEETLAVLFYTAPDGKKCLRYLVSYPADAQPVTACQRSERDTMIVVYGRATARGDAGAGNADKVQTIIAGRVLDDRTTTAAIEFTPDSVPHDPLSAQIDQQGFIVIIPSDNVRPTQVVPIDQYGNLTGAIYRFEP